MELVRATDDSFCIAVLGDFLGEEFASRPDGGVSLTPQRVTPDSVMNLVGLRPRIPGPEGWAEIQGGLAFSSLQGFDPGEMFKTLPVFQLLRDAREAARTGAREPEAPSPSPASPEDAPDGGGLLDAILDVTQGAAETPPPGSPEEIAAFVRQAVRPHLVRDDGDAKARVAAADAAASIRISELLHSPSFQRLESIWRSLVFLLSRVDTTGKVRVYLVQMPKGKLAGALPLPGEAPESKLLHLLSSAQLGAPGRRLALAVGAYSFSDGEEDLSLLHRIAGVARAADMPWLSSFDPAGNREDGEPGPSIQEWLSGPADGWAVLRSRPEAAWLGLTHPRFLLREPYGKPARPVREFDFREDVTSSSHILWGLGPFLPAALLANGFASTGWGFRPGRSLDLEGMPLVEAPDETRTGPRSLERVLDPGEARSLMERGVMPLVGFPERAGIRVGGIHPVTGPTDNLRGWWRGRS